MIWSFGGTVGTGVTGACADLGECAYQENQGVNKGMAITLLVLHIITFFYAAIVNGDVSKLHKVITCKMQSFK